MRIRLSIDEEFRQIAPPISKAEHDELERSLIAEGCRDPIVIWDGVILDGHHRYEICRRRNIPFQVKDMHLDCREEAIASSLPQTATAFPRSEGFNSISTEA